MTDVVETHRKVAVFGDIKIIQIQTSAAADDGHLIDLNSDATNGRGTALHEVLLTLLQDDEGADFTSTWDPATGIITIGNGNTLTTGIHNILIIGR